MPWRSLLRVGGKGIGSQIEAAGPCYSAGLWIDEDLLELDLIRPTRKDAATNEMSE